MAAINPTNDTDESAEHLVDRIVRCDSHDNSCPGIEEEKDNAENENINIDDEIELESDFVVGRISRGQQIM